MKYRFKDIENIARTPEMRVLAICGSHNIFVDLIVNDIKEEVAKTGTGISFSIEEDDEFSTVDEKEATLDFETFMKVCSNLSPTGKWLCKVNWDFLNKKNKERIKAYLKKPSEYAMLIIVAQEWKNIKELRSIRTFDSSKYSNLIDIQYPRRAELENIVANLFLDKQVRLGEDSLKLFILKLGTAYDEYKPNIDFICDKLGIEQRLKDSSIDEETKAAKIINIDFKEFKESMMGIDYFVIEDFMLQLLNPIHNKKVVRQRKVYKMLATLRGDYSAKEICNKLRYKIEELMYYRAYINNGCIPVRTRYNCEKIKERLPEDSKLRKATSITFKKNAYIASLTSIEDWYFMYSILSRNKPSDSDEKYLATILALMSRTAVSNDRLMNDLRVKDTLTEGLSGVNGLYMSEDYWRTKNLIAKAIRNSMVQLSTGGISNENSIKD